MTLKKEDVEFRRRLNLCIKRIKLEYGSQVKGGTWNGIEELIVSFDLK